MALTTISVVGPQVANFAAVLIAAPAADTSYATVIGKHNGGSGLMVPAYLATPGSDLLAAVTLVRSQPLLLAVEGFIAPAGVATEVVFPEGVPAGVTVTVTAVTAVAGGGATATQIWGTSIAAEIDLILLDAAATTQTVLLAAVGRTVIETVVQKVTAVGNTGSCVLASSANDPQPNIFFATPQTNQNVNGYQDLMGGTFGTSANPIRAPHITIDATGSIQTLCHQIVTPASAGSRSSVFLTGRRIT